jgi:hypothetical protein
VEFGENEKLEKVLINPLIDLMPPQICIEVFDNENSSFNPTNPYAVTTLKPFTYGQEYMDKFRKFPDIGEGYTLTRIADNKKSWAVNDVGTRKDGANFNGVDYEFIDQIKSENTEGVFFSVSLKTDEIMNICRTIADKNFMFYWVDAIFFQTEKTKNDIIEYLNDLNIPYKIKIINKVKLEPYLIKVWDDKKLRLFNFKKENNII